MWGEWQVGNLTAADYAEKARQWAHAMRLVDPTIKLVSCGKEVSLTGTVLMPGEWALGRDSVGKAHGLCRPPLYPFLQRYRP